MGASTRLSSGQLTVEPGGRQACDIQVRNTGAVVDQFIIDVVGDARGWTVVEPATLNVYPGEEATARVEFHPPRSSSVRAGDVPFAVRVVSTEDAEGSGVEEGIVAVGGFIDVAVAISPRTSRGRRRARHELTVENRGNIAVPLDIAAADVDQQLRFSVAPTSFTADAGTATFVKVRPRPVKRFWKGPNKTLPFQTFVTGQQIKPVTADAAMLQEQLLPRWLLPAVALLMAGCAVLVGLWFLVLKPAVKSTATDEATKQTKASTQTANHAQQAAQQAQANSQRALTASGATGGKGAGHGAGGAGGAGGANGTASTGSPSTTPTGGRIQLTVKPGSSGSQSLAGVPKNKAFELTDVILENPNGDLGSVFLKRGKGVLFDLNLADFRDLDYHFVSPITVPKGTPLIFSADCANTTKRQCTPAVYLGGYLQ
jgi:hypothetical protein